MRREPMGRLARRADHALAGVHSPGPSMYKSKNTMGDGSSNGATRYNNQPAYTFGTEDRFCY